MNIRPYTADDFDNCVRIFRSNIPKYFDESESSDFEDFLKNRASELYWVIEQDGNQVGCGGIRVRPDGSGGLSYGMVANDLHKKGIGKALTNFRILELLNTPELSNITLETSQHTYPFYERFGFQVTELRKDFYGEGLDCYSMNLTIPEKPLDIEKLKRNFLEETKADKFPSSPLTSPAP